MNKSRLFQGKVGLIILGAAFLALSCGGMNQAEYGAKITLPESTSLTSSVDVVFITKAVVIDKDEQPLNDVEVEFTVCCDGGEIIDDAGGTLENPIVIKTNNKGVAEINVLVYGNYAGQVIVTGDIGTMSDQTTITKAIP